MDVRSDVKGRLKWILLSFHNQASESWETGKWADAVQDQSYPPYGVCCSVCACWWITPTIGTAETKSYQNEQPKLLNSTHLFVFGWLLIFASRGCIVAAFLLAGWSSAGWSHIMRVCIHCPPQKTTCLDSLFMTHWSHYQAVSFPITEIRIEYLARGGYPIGAVCVCSLSVCVCVHLHTR